MKVLLINDYYEGGGAEAVFRNTISILKENGIEVDYFVGSTTMKKPSSALGYIYNKDIQAGLLEKLKSFQPTVIHLHSFYHILSGSIFKAIKVYRKERTVKVVFTAHDYYLVSPSSGMIWYKNGKTQVVKVSKHIFRSVLLKTIDFRGWKHSLLKKIQWFYNLKVKKVSKEIDFIISPSSFLRNVFEVSGVSIPSSLIRNPRSISKETNNTLKRKVPLTEELRLIYTGRLSEEKGMLPFLEVLAELDLRDIQLDIFGKGAEKEKLQECIEANRFINVKLHGYVEPEEIEQYIQKANVHVLPSIWYENAPLTIIEGASAGNVILASNIGGVAEMTKLTSSFILVDNWETDLKQSLELLRSKESNSVIDEEQFLPETYFNNLLKIYQA